LHAFHAKHFAGAPQPPIAFPDTYTAASEECYEEENLGYYPDGAERTLTDEQIAMFRHSEIQRIIRERRRRHEQGKPIEEEEREEEEAAVPQTHSPTPAQATSPDAPADEGSHAKPAATVSRSSQSGGIDKPSNQQWATSSARTKARNKRNRDRYKVKKRDARLKREQARKDKDAEESDEWDPWHQAKGPDVQQDDTVDLDY
jgi:hypothetical protein